MAFGGRPHPCSPIGDWEQDTNSPAHSQAAGVLRLPTPDRPLTVHGRDGLWRRVMFADS